MPGPGQPTSYKGAFEASDKIKTSVVKYDVAATRDTPVLRFPSAGRVVGAYFVSGYASSGTNVLQVGLRNGGNSGVGTVQTAPQSNGTVVAGSAYALAVATTGPEMFVAGDFLLLNVTSTLSTTDLVVQIDYIID